MLTLRVIGAFPTWALTNAVTPFLPASHPWHGRTFSLRDWHAGQTPLCRLLDIAFFWSMALSIVLCVLLYRR